jgi:4-hydroxybenzoate polyprenyltransferase
VRPNEAKFLLALFLVVLLIILFLFHKTLFSAVILFYVFMNVLYSVSLKNKPVIDIFIISLGFVLRVIAGALSINVHVSNWMFVTTLCLTLYLAIIKRRQELKSSGEKARGVLAFYTESLLDRYADMSATGAIVFYSLYVMSANPKLILSIPFVIYGLFRYWYIVERHESGESPTDALYEDWQLVVVVLIWISVCAYVLWSS